MRVLVTGGSGYVGSHTIRELSAAGHDLIVYDNLSTGHRKLSDGFQFIEGDIADQEKLTPVLKRVDAVMHFAASAYVGESVTSPRKYFRNNVESSLRFLDAVLESDVRFFVFSSSCAVYGIPQQLPIVESSPREPLNPYGATKLFLESVLEAYAGSHGLRYVALRYFNAAGAHISGTIGECHNPETHLLPLALKAALGTAPPLTIFGQNLDTPDGTCIRDFVHVSDLGSGHLQALSYLANGGPSVALNLGTGRGTSVLELLNVVEKVSQRKVPHSFAAPRVGDPPALLAAADKARDVLGWSPQFGLQQIVETAWRWEERLQSFVK